MSFRVLRSIGAMALLVAALAAHAQADDPVPAGTYPHRTCTMLTGTGCVKWTNNPCAELPEGMCSRCNITKPNQRCLLPPHEEPICQEYTNQCGTGEIAPCLPDGSCGNWGAATHQCGSYFSCDYAILGP